MKRLRGWLLLAALAIVALGGWPFTPKTSSQTRATQKAAANDKTAAGGKTAPQPQRPIVWTPPAVENYDLRADESKAAAETREAYRRQAQAAAAARKPAEAGDALAAARAELAARVPGLRVEPNRFGNAPEIVGTQAGCQCALTEASDEPRETVVRRFVAANAALYGLTAEQVAELRTVADYTNPAGNLSWVEYEQRVNDIPVFQGYLRAALTSDGRLARTTGNLAAALAYDALPVAAKLTPAAAVAAAAAAVNVYADPLALRTLSTSKGGRATKLAPGPFTEETKTELVYFPVEPGVAVLAYASTLWLPHEAFYVLVDADTGRLLWRKNITQEQTQAATYSVYNDDSPSPLSPTNALPGSGFQPPFIQRTSVTVISELPAFDNLGWITDGGNTTTGNNVDAGLDIDGTNGIDANGRATGSPNRVFNFAYDPSTDAPSGTNYRMGAVTNLFFWSNRYHDLLYQLGFTEAARNFQTNNFGRGGLGNDFVRAEVQDSSGTNNANFSTSTDGSQPRMQMYIFPGPNPDRDGDLDGDVFLHELTHGTSNRLHANGTGLATTQSGGMGEGWSDFYARALLSSADEDVNGLYASGGYVTNQLAAGFTDNYYYGIRRFPYAVKTNVGGPTATRPGQPHNPITFADIDTALFNITDGAYNRNPALNQAQAANEVHAIGEVWCMMLLEVRARVIQRMGWAAGNQRMLQIVTDAMKLDVASPTIIQARDSLIAADCAGFNGADEQDIWAGFAARGAGFGAATTGNTTAASDVTESFTTPNLNLGTVTFSDAAGNNNGAADPGETISLSVPLSNPFCGLDATNATAAVTGGGTGNYGTIAHGATGTQSISYTVPANTTCGTQLTLPINVSSSLGQITRNYSLRVGTLVIGQQQTFSNATAVVIPGTGTGTTTGAPANPYPSNITVANFNAPVTKVTVTLANMNHTFPGDVDVLLVGPTGRKFVLVSDVLDTRDWTGQTYTFDDDASGTLPASATTVPPTGTYRPTNFEATDAFPAPAPATPYLSPAPVGTDTLASAFAGQNPNGTWSLYVVDDASTDAGNFNGGWSLTLTSSSYQCTAACNFTSQPANISVNNDAGACGALVNFTLPTLSCSGTVTADKTSGTVFPVGTTTVNVTGTPSGGGATVQTSFTITVTDAENPQFTAPAANVYAASTNGTNAVVNFSAPPATDNCAGVLVTSNPPSGSTFPVGTTEVTHTATDAHGRTATTTSNVTVVPQAQQGDVLISEFRLDGPNGGADEFIELYNNTNQPVTVASADGSAGWAVALAYTCRICDEPADQHKVVSYFSIPGGTVIPARGHLLWTNVYTDGGGVYRGYSLKDYGGANAAAGDLTGNFFRFIEGFEGAGDEQFDGFALFTSANQTNWTQATRLDAVGSVYNSNAQVQPLFVEGTGLHLSGDYGADGQYSWVRTQAAGTPQDTGNNAQDFVLVSPAGSFQATTVIPSQTITTVLGAPGPENATSPIQRNATVKASLIEPQQASTDPPNRVRDTTPNVCGNANCALGTLEIRRRFKNSTGQPITKLRFRVVDITTLNTPNPGGAQADLRFLDSANISVTTSLGTLTLRGTLVETPPVQAGGGGLNSSAVVNLPGAIQPNVSVDVRFLLGVQTGGRFRFLVNVEAQP
ncbi:MAG TPA: M36 family metallopeptidase [Pyrinomonadaceae bacterium]|jgi:subtilisin-like proprotein convertase family protein